MLEIKNVGAGLPAIAVDQLSICHLMHRYRSISIYTLLKSPENPVAAAEARGCDGLRSRPRGRSCGPYRSLVPRQRLQKIRPQRNCVDTYSYRRQASSHTDRISGLCYLRT